MRLDEKYYQLLIKIINNTKCFDRRDNTFNLSNRKIAEKCNISPSSVDRLFRELNKKDLIRKVRNTQYKLDKKGNVTDSAPVRMLNPCFLFISYARSDFYITYALFVYRDCKKVDQWRDDCRKCKGLIDIDTGELTEHNWYYIDKKANSYSMYDRCYRKGLGAKNLYDTYGYSAEDLRMDGLTETDIKWLNHFYTERDTK